VCRFIKHMYLGVLYTCVGALGNTMSFIDLSVRNSDGIGGKCLHWLLFCGVHILSAYESSHLPRFQLIQQMTKM